MKKKLIIVLIVIIVLISIFTLYLRLGTLSYYKKSSKAFKIPGLKDGFIAQGIDYKDNKYFMTGYMKNKSGSPVYVIDEKTNEYKKVYLKLGDDSYYTGHAGGIAVSDKYIYIASDMDGLFVYSYEDLMNAKNMESIDLLGNFNLNHDNEQFNIAFVTIRDNKLVVGEFYRKSNYKTHISHQIKTPSNDNNKALALTFLLDDSNNLGIGELISAYSIKEKVQGIEFYNDDIYLSTSYGIAFSNIYRYSKDKIKEDKITLYNKEIPLYYLDSSSLTKKIKTPPMSEEILINDNNLYIVTESASKKYLFGNLIGAKYIYKTDLKKVK